MPDTGVLRVLTSQQRATGWRRQLEVEKSLGLEKGTISGYFSNLGRAHKSKSTSAARRQLRVAGVYRVQGLRLGKPRPPKNWWIAFAGKGNPRPVLHLSRESHPFAPEGAPGEQGDFLAGVAEPSEGGQGSPSTAVPETREVGTGGSCTAILGRSDCVQVITSSTAVPETSEGRAGESCTAAPERSEGDRGGTSTGVEERIEGVRRTSSTASTAAPGHEDTVDGVNIKCMRSRWLREPPLQAMMSSCTWDYFLTSDELGKFLGIKEDDLKPILSRVSRSGSDDDTFLRTCGIRRRQFNRKSRYCLLGCGNLVTLGPELCVELLAIEPQPLYWGMTPRGVDASTNVMAGFESLGTIKTMIDLSKAIQASLLCRRCTSGIGARWSFMRRESKARMILSRGAPPELGLNFECDVCSCIHLGESLPDTVVRDFEKTSLSNATEVFLRTLPSLYRPEFDGVPKSSVTTVGRISPHGAIGNFSTVTHPLAGSTGNSRTERSNPACPSPKTQPAGTYATPPAQTRQTESPRSVVSLHPLATATQHLDAAAAKASPSSRCQAGKKRGVSSDFLATQQHYKRGKAGTCEAVQLAWSAGGSRSSPGAESETAP